MNEEYLEQIRQEEQEELEKERARIEKLGIGERTREFLRELSKLTKKYDIQIGGCGCCDSPYLNTRTTDEYIAGNLYFDETYGKYVTDKQPFEVQKEHTRDQLTKLDTRVSEVEKRLNTFFKVLVETPEERADKIFRGLEQMQKKFEERQSESTED